MSQKRNILYKQAAKRKNFKFLLLALLIINSSQLLTACSYLPDWLGEAKKNSGIKGQRISVLNLESSTSADTALATLKILIPEPASNKTWHKSSGLSPLLPGNIQLAHELPVKVEHGIGGGASYGQHMTASPIIADGKIFVITATGQISAVDATNINNTLWTTKLKIGDKKEKLSSAAGISYHNGKIFVATGTNEVGALDAASGRIIWTKNINSIARSAPEAKDNVIYVNTIDNRLYALNANDGGILWTHTGGTESISMFGSASPVTSENIVIAPYSSGEIYALNAVDGSEIWSDTFSRRSISAAGTLSDIDAAPVINNGKIFVISNDGVLASADIKTGKRLWEQAVSGRQTPWIAGDFLYLITNKNEIVCVHIPSGGIKWIKQLQTYKKENSKKDPIKWSGPVLAGDLLWLVSSHGKLMAISPRDGAIEYDRKVPKDIYLAPVVAYGNMYLYSDDAELVVLSDNSFKNPRKATAAVLNEEKSETNSKIESVNQNNNAGKPVTILHKIGKETSTATHKMVNGVKSLFGKKTTDNNASE